MAEHASEHFLIFSRTSYSIPIPIYLSVHIRSTLYLYLYTYVYYFIFLTHVCGELFFSHVRVLLFWSGVGVGVVLLHDDRKSAPEEGRDF